MRKGIYYQNFPKRKKERKKRLTQKKRKKKKKKRKKKLESDLGHTKSVVA